MLQGNSVTRELTMVLREHGYPQTVYVTFANGEQQYVLCDTKGKILRTIGKFVVDARDWVQCQVNEIGYHKGIAPILKRGQ